MATIRSLVTAAALSSACGIPVHAQNPALSPDSIQKIMRKACDYQLSQGQGDNGWIGGAFRTGAMAMYYCSADEKYRANSTAWAQSYSWAPPGGATTTDANNQCCFQTYAEIYLLDPSAANAYMIQKAAQNLDYLATHHGAGRSVWSWCDALFMAAPAMVRLSTATGDDRYIRLMDTLWWDNTAFLYDTADHLYFRDASYLWPAKRTANGRKVFWSRGNGWVMGGAVRVLHYLPPMFPTRSKYETLLREMAATIIRVQGSDGLWRTSLLDSAEYPTPETSGSAFFCYALAWGINHGILESATYLPAVEKAWTGLAGKVTAQGKLGYVQNVNQEPSPVTADGSMPYAVGAFLLAGYQAYHLMGGADDTAFRIVTGPLPDASLGHGYNQQLNAANGASPFTWGIAAGSLPPGMALSASGMISGTPSGPEQSHTFTVAVQDADGKSATRSYTIAVRSLRFSDKTGYADAEDYDLSPAGSWSVDVDGADKRLVCAGAANSGDVPGATAIIRDRNFSDFVLSFRARSALASAAADFVAVFGYQNSANCYYMMFNSTAGYNQLFKLVNGARTLIATASQALVTDAQYHAFSVSRAGNAISVSRDGTVMLSASDATFGAGRVGVGTYNDPAWFDDIDVPAGVVGISAPVMRSVDLHKRTPKPVVWTSGLHDRSTTAMYDIRGKLFPGRQPTTMPAGIFFVKEQVRVR
jgi:rhamnogalacturonyl hydrolase YesR